MRTKRRLAAVTSGVLLASTGGLVASTTPALAVDAPPGITVAQAAGSVAYLTARYGIPPAEALRRLDLQRIGPVLDAALSARFPDSFAGSELDQANGGLLIIHATDPAAVRRSVRDTRDAAHIRVVPARYSLRRLTRLATELDAELNRHGGRDRVAETTVDVEHNMVTVYQHAGADQTGRAGAAQREPLSTGAPATTDPRVAAAVAAHPGLTVARQLVAGTPKTKTLAGSVRTALTSTPACQPNLCAKPMRGGMRLDVLRNSPASVYPAGDALNADWGQCTNGFNVTDTSRKWGYILTAGHCFVGLDKVGNTLSYSSYETGRIPVGQELPDFENADVNGNSSYPLDWAIQPYQTVGTTGYKDYWLGSTGRNLVNSYCQAGEGTKTCTNGTFAITGYYDYTAIKLHWVVCGTGSGDASSQSGYNSNVGYHMGTRCGEVTGLDGGINTNLCMRPGDSGGPLFSEADSKAYGILTNGTDGHGPCPTNPAGSEQSNYSPISKVFSMAHDQTGYTFNVYTS